MSFKSIFDTMKKGKGVAQIIDSEMMKRDAREDTLDRKSVTNSPSSALGCVRSNYYQRLGTERAYIPPRVLRIFDNGHDVHERIQSILLKSGYLLMDEVPLFHKELEIQGHTDGIMKLKGNNEIQVLEIKSINSRGFDMLKQAREDHVAQAQVYLFCLEEQRKNLQEEYPTKLKFLKGKPKRIKKYREMYSHLRDGKKFSRKEKIAHKVSQHLQLDDILYTVGKEINQAVIFYENKDTQDQKEFTVTMDKELMDRVLEKFKEANWHWSEQKMPERECKTRNEGRWCNYVDTCFPM